MRERAAKDAGKAGRRLSWPLIPVLPLGVIFVVLGCVSPQTTRLQVQDDEDLDKEFKVLTIGDVTEVGNVRPEPLSGVGLVINLEGTGGPAPKSFYRAKLEEELRKQKVKDIKGELDSPDHALVLVTALIPPGARRGDPLNVEVMLPQGSKATSLRGGYLKACQLRTYETSQGLKPDAERGNRLLEGHVLARAQGPVLVGLGGDEDDSQRKGRLWEGGISFSDRPLVLALKNEQKYAKVANAVAEHINAVFQDDPNRQQRALEHHRLLLLDEMTNQINEKHSPQAQGKGDMAKPVSKDFIFIRVPWEYRLNPERYLRVVRLMPLREVVEARGPYRQRLRAMLLDPARTVRAALRLEALGKDSAPALKEGLGSGHPLVRFCAAEALTYLGNPAGAEELARLARQYDPLRAHCLLALASLDEAVCREKLAELLEVPAPELRYGAFHALRLLDEQDPHIQGSLLNGSFWLHRVEPQSPPLVHFTTDHRAEVVLFGSGHQLVPPVVVRAREFTVTARAEDDRIAVSRFMVRASRIERRLCSPRLEDVLRTLAELGAQYPEVVEVLTALGNQHLLSCPIKMDALPQAVPAEELAQMGRDPELWRAATAANDAATPPAMSGPAPTSTNP
jgi:hypothetical protein